MFVLVPIVVNDEYSLIIVSQANSAHLYPRLVQFRHPGQLLAHVYIRIVALGERRFQLLQLFLRERRPVPPPGGRLARRRGVDTVTGHRKDAAGGSDEAANRFRLDLLKRTFDCVLNKTEQRAMSLLHLATE